MHDVFISYAHEERTLARKLADALLAARGWSVWWDTSLRTGEQFPKRIQDAVAASRCVVVLWSKHSIDSNWVVAEASEGWERQVLAPALLDDSEPPMPFRQTQARDLSQWHGAASDASLLALIEDIQRIHAQGAVIDTAELAQREQRRRAFRRKRWIQRAAIAGAAMLAISGGWFTWRQIEANRAVTAAAEDLAGKSQQVLVEVTTLTPEEEKRIWWSNLFESPERVDKLQLSLLLAIEAMRLRHTERTERALREALALAPWSDQRVEIADQDIPEALVFNGTGRLVAAGAGARGTLIWDLDRNEIIARIDHGGSGGKNPWEDKRGRVYDGRGTRAVIDFNRARDVVATAGPDATARIWEARTGREIHRLSHAGIATAVAFDPKGERLATSDESGAVCLWNAGSGEKLRCMYQSAPVYWVAFSPSGASLASVARDGSVAAWDSASGKRRLQVQGGKEVRAARFDPQEKLVATFGPYAETRLWKLDDGSELWKIEDGASEDAGVAFDPPTRTLILGGAEGTVTWWDMETRAKRFSIPVDTYVAVMAVSTATRYLVTADTEGEARAWDLDTGRLLKRMPYHPRLGALAMSPDGLSFATAGDDGYERALLEFTRIVPADPVAAACKGLGRNLTRDEWHRYLGAEPYRLTCPNIEAETTD
jgi:hypothetical protein